MKASTAFVLLDPVKLWTFLDMLLLGVATLSHITNIGVYSAKKSL